MTIEGYHFRKPVFSRENPPHKPIVFVNKHEPIVFVSKRAFSLSHASEPRRLDSRGAIKFTEITNKNVSYFLKMAIKQNLTNLQKKCLKYLNLQAKKSNCSFYVESQNLYVKIKGILDLNCLNFFKSHLAGLNVKIDLDLNYNHSPIVNEMIDGFGFIEKDNIYLSPLLDFINLFAERIAKISFEGAVNRYWYIYEFIASNPQLINLHTICFDFSKFFPWAENKSIDFQNFFERADRLKKLTLIGRSFANEVKFPSSLEELTLNFSETIPVLDLLGLKNLKKFTAGPTSFSAESGSKIRIDYLNVENFKSSPVMKRIYCSNNHTLKTLEAPQCEKVNVYECRSIETLIANQAEVVVSIDNQSLEVLEAAAATEVELFECESLCSIHIQKEIFEYIKVLNCYEMNSEYSETYSLERFLKSLLKSNDRKLALMKFIQKVLLKEWEERKKSCSTELTLLEATKHLEEIGLACKKYSHKEYLGCVSEILHI